MDDYESGLEDEDEYSGYGYESSDRDSERESEEGSEEGSEEEVEEESEGEVIETSDEDTESSDDPEDESNGSLSGFLPSSQSPSLASASGSAVQSARSFNNHSSQRSDSVLNQGGEMPVHAQRQGRFCSRLPDSGAASPRRNPNSDHSARPASILANLFRPEPNHRPTRPLHHPSSPNSLDDSEMDDLAGFVDLTSPTTLGRTENGSNVGPSTGPRGLKRRRSQDSPRASAKRQAGQSTSRKSTPLQNIEQVNLLNVDDDAGLSAILKHQQEEQVKAQQQDKDEFPRLSTLQCVICLEPPTNLTATICGHLFCHTCLMEALISGEATKTSRCPVCRTKLRREKHGRDGGKGKDWQPLELKFLLKDKDKEKGKGKDTG